jgi:hypothetical protein
LDSAAVVSVQAQPQ